MEVVEVQGGWIYSEGGANGIPEGFSGGRGREVDTDSRFFWQLDRIAINWDEEEWVGDLGGKQFIVIFFNVSISIFSFKFFL